MKIAFVHHCNYGSQYMTDKSWWFQIPEIISDEIKEGNFVVTENKLQRSEACNLCISWVEKIKDNEEELKAIFTIFASEGVIFHETNPEKAKEIISERIGEIVSPPCIKCGEEFYKNEMKIENVSLNVGEEFVILGLGWITVKRGPLKFDIELPKYVKTVIREALITPKRVTFYNKLLKYNPPLFVELYEALLTITPAAIPFKLFKKIPVLG